MAIAYDTLVYAKGAYVPSHPVRAIHAKYSSLEFAELSFADVTQQAHLADSLPEGSGFDSAQPTGMFRWLSEVEARYAQ